MSEKGEITSIFGLIHLRCYSGYSQLKRYKQVFVANGAAEMVENYSMYVKALKYPEVLAQEGCPSKAFKESGWSNGHEWFQTDKQL